MGIRKSTVLGIAAAFHLNIRRSRGGSRGGTVHKFQSLSNLLL